MRGVVVDANPKLLERFSEKRGEDVGVWGAVQPGEAEAVHFFELDPWEMSTCNANWLDAATHHNAKLVKRHDVPRVDVPSLLSAYFPVDVAMTILNIDIEGDSLNALRQIDLTKYAFDLILIEVDEQEDAVEACKSSLDIPDYEHVVTLGPTLGFRRVASELRATS